MSTDYYLFVIDTNAYAGNFERDMCAYMTGHVGDCGVGIGMAELYAKDEGEPLYRVISVPDEQGCNRPTSIWPSPNGDMNSVAIFFETRPNKNEIALLKRRAAMFLSAPKGHQFDSRPTKILGFRLIEKKVTYEEEIL